MKNYLLGFQAKISHYVINDIIFIDYLEAFKYCLKNKIDINLIIKTKKYIYP